MNLDEESLMRLAIEEARAGIASGQSPFGALIVRGGAVVASSHNTVWRDGDPTAHAEVNGLRIAARALGTIDLKGCTLYSTCEPCPMCLAALYWSRCRAIYFGACAEDAAMSGFDDAFLYAEVCKPIAERTVPTMRLLGEKAKESFAAWDESPFKVEY